jgi:hypothetical protein
MRRTNAVLHLHGFQHHQRGAGFHHLPGSTSTRTMLPFMGAVSPP